MSFKEIVNVIVDTLKHNYVCNMVLFLLWVFNFIGGTGMLFYYGQPQFAISNIILLVVVFFIAYAGSDNERR